MRERSVRMCVCAVIAVGVGHVLLSVKRPDPSTSPPTLSHWHVPKGERARGLSLTHGLCAHAHSRMHAQRNHLHLYRPAHHGIISVTVHNPPRQCEGHGSLLVSNTNECQDVRWGLSSHILRCVR